MRKRCADGDWDNHGLAAAEGGLDRLPQRGDFGRGNMCRLSGMRAVFLLVLFALAVVLGGCVAGGGEMLVAPLRMLRGKDEARPQLNPQLPPALSRTYTPKLMVEPTRISEPHVNIQSPSSAVYSNACDDGELILSKNADADVSEIVMVGGRLVMPGVPVNNVKAEADVYVNFQACLPAEKIHRHYHDIHIRIRALEGDPDLFISVSKPNPRIDDSTWLSKDSGDDEITIATNHPDFIRGTKTLYFQ